MIIVNLNDYCRAQIDKSRKNHHQLRTTAATTFTIFDLIDIRARSTGGYAKFTGLKTYNKNLKTMLAIGGWNEGSSRFSPMVADPARRREFVKNAIRFLRQNHFDGLDLDWEYPAFRDGGKPRDKDNYANLVQVDAVSLLISSS